jgi:hypothetical protein
MTELLSLSNDIKKIRDEGKRYIPVDLQNKILKKIDLLQLSPKEAGKKLDIHPITFSKWRRKRAGKFNNHKKVKGIIVDKELTNQQFIELPRIVGKTGPNLFIELDLGMGAYLRIYR